MFNIRIGKFHMPNSHYSSVTIRDRSKETSVFKFYNGAITATSIAGFLSDFGALKTAIAAITIGVVARDLWVGDSTNLSDAVPTDPFAQRELGLRVHYTGNTTNKPFQVTLPCPALSALTYVGTTDEIVLADAGVMAAFVAAFEQIARSPDDDQENVTIQKAEVVGRNN